MKGWGKAVLALILFVGIKFIVILLFGLGQELLLGPDSSEGLSTSALMAYSTSISSILILLALYFWRPVRLVPDRIRSLPLMFCIGLIFLGLIGIGLNSFVLSLLVDSQADLLEKSKFILDSGFLGIFSVVILVPIVEELIFRRVMIESISEQTRPIFAVIISALIFGSLHGEPVQILGATLLGLVFGLMYYESGSVIPSTLLHIFNNGYFVFALYLGQTDQGLIEHADQQLFSMHHPWGVYIAILLLFLFVVLARRLSNWSRLLKQTWR